MNSEPQSVLEDFEQELSSQLDTAIAELTAELEIADAELVYGTSS